MERVKRTKLAELLRKDYVQTVIMILIVIVIYLGLWYGLTAALKTNHPLFAVASGSMKPTLQVGDLIVVQGLNASEINANYSNGDIIVFRKPTNPRDLIVHRAVEKKLDGDTWSFRTKGDNNSGADPWWVSEKDLIGKVIGPSVPLLGYAFLFMQAPIGMLIVVAVMLVSILIGYLSFSEKTD